MNYFLLAPELVLVSVAIIIILVGLFLKTEQKRSLGYFSIFALTVALVLTLNTLNVKEVFLGNPIYNTLIVDSFGQFFNLIFLSVAIIVAISSLKYYKDNPNQDEYYSLLLFATTGMMIVALANDLISLYVGLELASLSTYVLAGFNKKDPRSLESAMKYFIIGA
ncbi:MAG: NADH-quinone oxidoreductase subunit N, partial [Euryarchaeota archaeon]|nr:NADH-quinone oxidoreductase subunit N [Euryarchaeota archaeon]